MADHDEPLVPEPMRALDTVQRPIFALPEEACDTHMHVFGPVDRYPHVPHPHYTVPPGELSHYRRLMERLALQRFVIVQPSFYGTDNRCLLDALAVSGDAARGVVMIAADTPTDELERMHAAGVRGVRLDLFQRSALPRVEIEAYIAAMARKVAPLGWHLQFYAPGFVVRDLIDFLHGLEADHVIDHMGYMLEKDGLTEADFGRLLALLRGGGRTWLKLSAPYRLSGTRGYEAVAGTACAIVEAAPGRAIWGTDWPHIPGSSRDTGELLNLVARWAPDPSVRRQILTDNPRTLFGFA